jgi:acylphosphatase
MKFGRLIRVGKIRNDPHGEVYVVAEFDAARAVELIRAKLAGPGDEIEDLGRVTDVLLTALNLKEGEFARTLLSPRSR